MTSTFRLSAIIKTSLGTAAAAVALAASAPAAAVSTVADGKLTIGSDLTYPPYVYMQDGKPAGFDAEFSKMLAAEMNLEPIFVDTRFPDLILGMRANRFDIVASALYVTPERHKLVNYVPYLKTGSSLIVLGDSTFKPATVDELCGKKVSSIKGASWTPKLNKVSEEVCKPAGKGAITVLEYPTSPEALMALKSKAADVMMEDAAVSHELAELPANDIQVTSNTLIYPIVIGLGVNKDAKELLDALNKALKAATDNGKYPALLKKYGLEAPTEQDVKTSLGQS